MSINRRNLITGLISFAAAPAIVRAESLMKIKVVESLRIYPFSDEMIKLLIYSNEEIIKMSGVHNIMLGIK